MKKIICLSLLFLLIFGMQNVFAKDRLEKNEISVFGIYDYKISGSGKVNDQEFNTSAKDSQFDAKGNYGVGLGYRTKKSDRLSCGPTLALYWAKTKDKEEYSRFILDYSADYSFVNGNNADLYAEIGLGADYSQIGTCSTLGFDGNVGLGFKYNLGDGVKFVVSSAFSVLVEVYDRDGKVCTCTQYDIPTKLGIAFEI